MHHLQIRHLPFLSSFHRLFGGDIPESPYENDFLRFQFFLQRRRLEQSEEDIVPETNNNPNFLKEKDMKFSLYPLYINWKKIESNEEEYYKVFVHYGYFGSSVYSLMKNFYEEQIFTKNFFFMLCNSLKNFLRKNNNNKRNNERIIFDEEDEENDEEFIIGNSNSDSKKSGVEEIKGLPNFEEVVELVKKKIILFKELPVFIMVLKIYEIMNIVKKDKKLVVDTLKAEFLLLKYMTDDEYKEIFSKYFSGKVNQIFKKLEEEYSENYRLPKTKNKGFNHLKKIYKLTKSFNEKENKENKDFSRGSNGIESSPIISYERVDEERNGNVRVNEPENEINTYS